MTKTVAHTFDDGHSNVTSKINGKVQKLYRFSPSACTNSVIQWQVATSLCR